MARLPDVPDEAIPEVLREMAEGQRRHYGTLLNSLRMTAYVPHVALGQAAMTRELARSHQVPRRLSSLVNLRVAAIIGCPQ